MTRRLKRYVERRSKDLERTFPQLSADDLIGDCWTIYLSSKDNDLAFLSIRRHFNAVKMRTIREARRFVSLESIAESARYAYNPEDAMIAKVDLSEELEEVDHPTTEWKSRVARERIKRYLDGD